MANLLTTVGEMSRRGFALALAVTMLLLPLSVTCDATRMYSGAVQETASTLSVPQDFVIRYLTVDKNESKEVVYESSLELSSNGSAKFSDSWARSYLMPGRNLSAVLSQTIVNYTREAMDEDDLCAYNGTYNDANLQLSGVESHTDEFYINTSCGNRTLRFCNDAMIGILPNTCVAINKIIRQLLYPEEDALKINVEVSAVLEPDANVSISATVQNDGAHEFSMSGVCESIWPVKIVRTNGYGVVHLPTGNILPTCVVTVGPGASYQFELRTWNASGIAMGDYVVMADPGALGMTILQVPQDMGHVNQQPIVMVEVSEVPSDAKWTYQLDASASCDPEDKISDLEVRWDWYSDGVWDTSWSFEKTTTYTFENTTGYNFTVEVRDSGGLSSTVSASMSETHRTQAVILPAAYAMSVLVVLLIVAFVVLKRRKV